ncbi:DapH/DapD/GlmU-related protein [Vibrio cyclitrophicus]
MLDKVISELGYNNHVGFNRYIYYRVLVTVVRGIIGRILGFFKCDGFISLGRNVSFKGPGSKIFFGSNCKVEDNVLIHSVCQNGIVFGDKVTICHGVLIRPTGYWKGNVGFGLTVGNRSSIGANSYIGCSGKIEIGDDVMIGPNISIIAENHIISTLDKPFNEQGVVNLGVTIGNNVWIGTKSTILDGVSIGDNSIVAAGAVVNKNIPSGVVVAGVPAKIIKRL